MLTPTLSQLLADAMESRLRDLHVALPGRVERYIPETDSVDVQPMVQRMVPGDDPEYDAPAFETLPVLPSVPLQRPRGGGFYVGLPVAKGDTVLLIFCERDIGQWRKTGDVANPGDQRIHSLAAACAIPGLFESSRKIDGYDGTTFSIGREGGLKIDITYSQMEVDGASDAAALASKVDAEFTKISTTLSSVVGATFGTPYAKGGSVASAKLKVGG